MMMSVGEDGISIVSQLSATITPGLSELAAAADSTSSGTLSNLKAAEELHVTLLPGSSAGDPSTCVVSSHIGDMIQRKGEFESEIDREIESSKVHWTEPRSTCDDDGKQVVKDLAAHLAANKEIFESLQEHPEWGCFFTRPNMNRRTGRKIAEGGQAAIFEVIQGDAGSPVDNFVWKVFKQNSSLQDLQKQWPGGLLEIAKWLDTMSVCFIWGGLLLEDGRFAFEMSRYWADLRKLIDRRIQQTNNQSPPFTKLEVGDIMWEIATGMKILHRAEILHRDLKASNVLIRMYGNSSHGKPIFDCSVADFECSVGVVGTGFWRAPEILRALQNANITSDSFTKMADVYSYALTCYEVLTGRIPFEDHPRSDYSRVLNGDRPELPDYIDPWMRALLVQCWHPDPLKRPTFESIEDQLDRFHIGPHLSSRNLKA